MFKLIDKKKKNSPSTLNSVLTDDDTRSFGGQRRSRSDCTERAV